MSVLSVTSMNLCPVGACRYGARPQVLQQQPWNTFKTAHDKVLVFQGSVIIVGRFLVTPTIVSLWAANKKEKERGGYTTTSLNNPGALKKRSTRQIPKTWSSTHRRSLTALPKRKKSRSAPSVLRLGFFLFKAADRSSYRRLYLLGLHGLLWSCNKIIKTTAPKEKT